MTIAATFDTFFYDIEGPIAKRVGIPRAIISGRFREGMHFRKEEVRDHQIKFLLITTTEQAYMALQDELKDQYEAVSKLWDSYKLKSDTFRANVKNDISSIEASAKKSTEATQRMMKSYSEVISTLSSADMTRAIENAERLAAALTTINQIKGGQVQLDWKGAP